MCCAVVWIGLLRQLNFLEHNSPRDRKLCRSISLDGSSTRVQVFDFCICMSFSREFRIQKKMFVVRWPKHDLLVLTWPIANREKSRMAIHQSGKFCISVRRPGQDHAYYPVVHKDPTKPRVSCWNIFFWSNITTIHPKRFCSYIPVFIRSSSMRN